MNRKNYQQSISQNELKMMYESAQSRMDANRDFAEKQKNVIESCPYFKTESEALSSALKKMRTEDTDCQIWAKFEKEDDVFRFVGWWIVTDDVKIKQAADYIGMAQMYDAPMLRSILYNNLSVDDVIAH
jgi:hypothetical protein